MIQRALEGVRVVDLTQYIAGPYCTKLLADYGADVVKVERPEGDAARRAGPFPADAPDPEKSGLFLHLNTNKRGAVLDLKAPEGVEALLGLVVGADMLVENFRPGVMERLGLGYERLRSVNPGLVMVSISDFGQTGPYRDYRGSEIVDYALGGAFYASGLADHPPIKLGGSVVQYLAGAHGAAAAIVALMGREARGYGDHVDVSIMETQAGSLDRRAPMLLTHQFTGHVHQRGRAGANEVRPCQNGYTLMQVSARHIDRLSNMLGRPEMREDPRFADFAEAAKPENREAMEEALLAWLLERPMDRAWDEAQSAHVLSGVIYTVEDALRDQGFQARRYWEAIEHPRARELVYPGLPFFNPDEAKEPRRPAPTLGQHTKEALEEARSEAPRPTPHAPRRDRLPLEGIRVADLTVVFAGPGVTSLLADWGAEVIRIEPLHVAQPATRGSVARPTQAMIDANRTWATGFPNFEPGERPWNRWVIFQVHARNKLSMTVDTRTPEGLDIFREIIRLSDIVVENNVPETIDKLGFGYEELRNMKPDIVMLRMPAYGLSGPYRNYRSLGSHLDGASGHTLLRSYPDVDVSLTESVLFGDQNAATHGAFAAAMALRQLQRTGRGQVVELAQVEALIPLLAEYYLDYQMNGRVAGPQGNDLYAFAPHNAYPCAGEDRWVAIAVGDGRAWSGLVQAMGNPAWASDPRFSDQTSRHEHRQALDELVSEWTRQHEDRWVMETLQAAGVPAGVLTDEPSAFDDPQLRARGFFQKLTHADCGTHLYPGIIWKMTGTPNAIRRPPCRLGEHNEYAYRELLGLSDDRFDALERAGHIGMDYHQGVP